MNIMLVNILHVFRYRILAVDNGLLSFTDQDHGSWSAVLVTNPKRANCIAPQVDRVENILASKVIRVLAFSPNEISEVKVKINKEDWVDCEEASENLFTTAWDPTDYVGTENIIKVLLLLMALEIPKKSLSTLLWTQTPCDC